MVFHGCSSKEAAESNQNILRTGNRSAVQDLDPHLVSGIAEFRALGALFEGLVSLDMANLEPIPGVAERWDISDDGLRYTFHIRDDAKWSNGAPVTAQDFVYSWKRMLTPELASEYSYMLHCLKNAKPYNEGSIDDFSKVGVKAVDDHTLEVTLEHPTPYFLSMQIHFAWFPVHKETVEKFGAMAERGSAWTHTGNHIGNGPFKLAAWRPGEIVKTTRNEHYWDADNVQLDGVEFYPIANEQTEERSFRAGKLDMTYTVPMYKIETYENEHPEELVIAPYLQTYFYRFNTTQPPFDDPRVRRAFGLALDREGLANHVLKAGESPAYFYTPPDTAGYTCDYKVSENVEHARELLAEAGYPDGEGLPTLTLLYNTSESDRIISEAVQQRWEETLNADVSLLNQDYKVYLASMSALDYNICRSTWLGDVYDPVNFLECFLSGGGNNRTGWSSEAFDANIQSAYDEANAEKRLEHLQNAEEILLEEAAITPVCFMTQKYLKNTAVKGLKKNILGYIRWHKLRLEP